MSAAANWSPEQLERFSALQRRALYAGVRLTVDRADQFHLHHGAADDLLNDLDAAEAAVVAAEKSEVSR